MSKKKQLKKAAAEAAAHAADTGHSAVSDGLAKAADVLADAQQKAMALIDEAQKKAVPAAKDAGARAADFASRQLDTWEPHIKDALDRVPPVVEAAREKISEDFLPRLQNMLHDAAEHPALAEATRRGEATLLALKGELEPVPQHKPSKLKKVFKFLAISAAVAGGVAAIRHFLTPKDDGWTAHEPSKAYVNNNDASASDDKRGAEGAEPSTATDAPSDSAPTDDADLVTEVTPEAPADTAERAGEDNPPTAEDEADQDQSEDDDQAEGKDEDEGKDYGEGSYVGDNPPEGFVIKGNERSMKYHLEGTGGYERTIPEVWFNSEDAAQAAGFTKAQR